MKWVKHGIVFDPARHALPAGCELFAQSPQALEFADFVRVYFSTRSLDATGKYLSRIAFADFSKDFEHIIQVSASTVIPLGDLGCFDEHGIFPMNVLRHEDRILAYTCGWSRRVSVSVETAIGLAVSRDQGLTFQRLGPGPVLAATLREPCLVGDAFVKIIDGTFHMWYIFGTGWRKYAPGAAPDRTYKIGHAISADGVDWIKEEARQIIADHLGADESQALPSVVILGKRAHMFFCFRQSFDFRTAGGRGYRLGHAYSDNLVDWVRDDTCVPAPGSAGEWDADMQCYPHVFECDGRICLLYNGNAFGRRGFGLAVLN